MSKSSLAFQPAPRPQPRASAEDAKKLQEATQDLGFGRPTAAPAATPEVSDAPVKTPALPRPRPRAVAPAVTPASTPSPIAEPALKRGPALKFDVPDGVWEELRLAALKRRVTVKFLVLEALAAKGYDVDLAAIPEDGRRLR